VPLAIGVAMAARSGTSNHVAQQPVGRRAAAAHSAPRVECRADKRKWNRAFRFGATDLDGRTLLAAARRPTGCCRDVFGVLISLPWTTRSANGTLQPPARAARTAGAVSRPRASTIRCTAASTTTPAPIRSTSRTSSVFHQTINFTSSALRGCAMRACSRRTRRARRPSSARQRGSRAAWLRRRSSAMPPRGCRRCRRFPVWSRAAIAAPR